MADKVAVFVKDQKSTTATQKVYRVTPPLSGYDFVCASAVASAFDTSLPEVLIFGCDADGKVVDYMDLDGSYRGDVDHERALRQAGYTIQGA